jgi:hypothetical protein
MPVPIGFKIADFGSEIGGLQNGAGHPIFKQVTIDWCEPKQWARDGGAPIDAAENSLGHVYAIVREHHKAKTRQNIAYIGISQKIETRFYIHPKAEEIRSLRGQAYLSIGNIAFGKWTHQKSVLKYINDIEHILIWAIDPDFNEKKMYSLPGFGQNGVRAWHIINTGHRFAGRMPREITYPWMILKPGRDRSLKKA